MELYLPGAWHRDWSIIASNSLQRQHAEERASTTPIQALPPASALDLDVLDALPLHLKRELERAYGEESIASTARNDSQGHRHTDEVVVSHR